MLVAVSGGDAPSLDQAPPPESSIATSIIGPRVVMFSLGFATPLLAIILTLALVHLLASPESLPLWAWPLFVTVSAAFGILAAVGLTYDLARVAIVDEEGVTFITASRRARYDWDDVQPRARVFPWQVRFKARDGTVFFLTTDMVEEISKLPFGPAWTPSDLGRW